MGAALLLPWRGLVELVRASYVTVLFVDTPGITHRTTPQWSLIWSILIRICLNSRSAIRSIRSNRSDQWCYWRLN